MKILAIICMCILLSMSAFAYTADGIAKQEKPKEMNEKHSYKNTINEPDPEPEEEPEVNTYQDGGSSTRVYYAKVHLSNGFTIVTPTYDIQKILCLYTTYVNKDICAPYE